MMIRREINVVIKQMHGWGMLSIGKHLLMKQPTQMDQFVCVSVRHWLGALRSKTRSALLAVLLKTLELEMLLSRLDEMNISSNRDLPTLLH